MVLPDLPCDGGGAPIRCCVGPYMLLLSPLGKSLPLLAQTHKCALPNGWWDPGPRSPSAAGRTESLGNQDIVATGLGGGPTGGSERRSPRRAPWRIASLNASRGCTGADARPPMDTSATPSTSWRGFRGDGPQGPPAPGLLRGPTAAGVPPPREV